MIGMMTFSKTFGFFKASKDWNNALHQIYVVGGSAAWRGQCCQRTPFQIFGSLFALVNRDGAVREFAVTKLTVRQSQGTPPQPYIMEKFIHVNDVEQTEPDVDAVRSMVVTNVFRDAESTTSSIRAVIYF